MFFSKIKLIRLLVNPVAIVQLRLNNKKASNEVHLHMSHDVRVLVKKLSLLYELLNSSDGRKKVCHQTRVDDYDTIDVVELGDLIRYGKVAEGLLSK